MIGTIVVVGTVLAVAGKILSSSSKNSGPGDYKVTSTTYDEAGKKLYSSSEVYRANSKQEAASKRTNDKPLGGGTRRVTKVIKIPSPKTRYPKRK